MAKITYPDKNTGDSFSAAEATEIKTVVNDNIGGSPGAIKKVNATGEYLEDAGYTYDQVVNISDINYSDDTWQTGEERLLATKKTDSTSGTFEGSVKLTDIFAPPGVDTQLANTNGWSVDELKILTGENYQGELGVKGQVRIIKGVIFRCISYAQGDNGGANGSATYSRNRAHDMLIPDSNAYDSAVADLLDPSRTGGNIDDGWDLVTNIKVISTISCRLGTVWKVAGSYTYICYAQSGTSYYWARNGQPSAIYRYITATNYPIITAALLAHDFDTSVYTETGSEETTYHDQVFYNLSTREYFVKINATQWEKLR